jgi:hypothetical protein
MAKGSKWCLRYDYPNDDCVVKNHVDCRGSGMSRAAADRAARGLRQGMQRSNHLDRCSWGEWQSLANSVQVVSMAQWGIRGLHKKRFGKVSGVRRSRHKDSCDRHMDQADRLVQHGSDQLALQAIRRYVECIREKMGIEPSWRKEMLDKQYEDALDTLKREVRGEGLKRKKR